MEKWFAPDVLELCQKKQNNTDTRIYADVADYADALKLLFLEEFYCVTSIILTSTSDRASLIKP